MVGRGSISYLAAQHAVFSNRETTSAGSAAGRDNCWYGGGKEDRWRTSSRRDREVVTALGAGTQHCIDQVLAAQRCLTRRTRDGQRTENAVAGGSLIGSLSTADCTQ